jgi:hypothetical protein
MIALAATLVIIPTCVLIALLFYLLSAFHILKCRTIERDVNLEKRLKSTIIVLQSAFQEIQEYGLDFNLEGPKEQCTALADLIDKAFESR